MKNIFCVISILFILYGIHPIQAQVYYPSEEEDQQEQQQEQPQQKQSAKEGSESSFMDRLYVGGGFGLGFGDVTYIQLMPVVGYQLTPKLSAGLRFMYQFRSYKDYYTQQTFNSNDFGIGPYARMILFGPIYAQVEYEYMNYEYVDASYENVRYGYNSFMAGGGIVQPIGGKAAFFLTLLYNFSYDSSDNAGPQPYGSPLIIRAGVTAGF